MLRARGAVVAAQLASFVLVVLAMSAVNRSTMLVAPMTFGATVGALLTD